MKVKSFIVRHRIYLILLCIVAMASFLRLYGQNWDQGQYLHPDERFIALVSSDRVQFPAIGELDQLFDPAHSPINPRRDSSEGTPESFAYGTLPIYVQGTASWLIDLVFDQQLGEYSQLYRVGRTLTAMLDVLTVLVVFLLGRRLSGDIAGLIAAALYTFAVLPIQLSHFFTVDVWLSFFVATTLYFAIRFVDQPSLARAMVVGIPVGMAFATKASVPSLLVPLAAAFAFVFWKSTDRRQVFLYAIAGAAVSLAMFTIFEPYAIIRHEPFIKDIKTQSRIVRGIFDVPFTRQFIGLTPGIYEIKNLVRYSIGPAFFIAGAGGVLWAFRKTWLRRDPALLILLLWIVSYVPILLYTEARFLRYSLPLLPALAVLGGLLLADLIASTRWRIVGQVATAIAVGITALWAFGFVSIYSETNPRIAASQWIYENIPPGSTITAESWDDPLPLRMTGRSAGIYQTEFMDIYGDMPPAEKVDYLYDTLNDVDYVILSSDRISGSVDNLPWRYAVQNEYYQRLRDGQLGFELVYEEELKPELFGIEYPNLPADESFWVYDQPRVQIFQRTEQLSRDEFADRFQWSVNQPWEPTRYPARQTLLLSTPVQEFDTNSDAQFNTLATSHDLVAIASWLVVLELIGLAVLPIAAIVLQRSPDRGALSAKLLGLLVIGWLIWIGASLDLWPARSLTGLAMFMIVGGLSWLSYVYLRRESRQPQLPGLSMYLLSSGIFLAIFGLFLGFRLYYPDFWQPFLGGEKPFELAYLRAVSSSNSFPPYDPWYSGGVINYYYYGWHLVATLTKFSGVGISNGFQLAAATIPALFSIQLLAITGLLFRSRVNTGKLARYLGAGAVVVFMVAVIGNLDAVRQLWQMRGQLDVQFDFWGSTRVIDFTINEFPWFTAIWADVHPHMMNLPIIALLLTLAVSFVVNQKLAAIRGSVRLRELILPLTLVSLCLGTLSVTNSWDMPLNVLIVLASVVYAGLLYSLRTGLLFGVFGVLVVGLSFALFAPFYLGFYSVAEGIARADAGSALSQFITVWGVFVAVTFCVVAAEFVRHLRQGWDIADGWVFSTIVLATGGATAFAFGTRNDTFSAANFILALLFVTLIISASAVVTRPLRFHPILLFIILAITIASAGLAAARPSASVALGVTAAAVMFSLRHWRLPSQFLPWAFVAVATVTIAATELVYVVDDLQNGNWQRMNTVFKFSLQAWVLFGIGAAMLLVRLWQSSIVDPHWFDRSRQLGVIANPEPKVSPATRARAKFSTSSLTSTLFAVVATGFVLAGLAYPIVGTPVRLRQNMSTTPQQLTLDGYAWMNGGYILNGTGDRIDFTGDLAAIEWLNANVDYPAVIVEAAIGPYRGNGARISSATGLPAVIGWDRHQRQQRYPEGIDQRMADVKEIYNSTDGQRKLDLLRAYRAEYVVVGDVERLWNTPEDPRAYASAEGLAVFDDLADTGDLDLVFESGNTRIYRIPSFPTTSGSGDRVQHSE